MYGGPNPPPYKTFVPRFYKTFAPRFYNFLHDFTISSTILQFPPRFYNFLHDITISSTILQFPPRFYNFLHDFTISSTILQFSPRFYNFLHDITISSTILQFPPRFYNLLHDFTICSTILQFAPRFYNLLHDFIYLCIYIGVYSQNDHLISLVIYNTFYKSILFPLCIMYLKHVCSLQKPKPNSSSTCPRMSSQPDRGKPHSNACVPLTIPAQRDITGEKPVRRYPIPSSTIVLPKTYRISERTGETRPQT